MLGLSDRIYPQAQTPNGRLVSDVLVTPPAGEVVALATAKAHLRVDHDAEDSLIEQYVAAAVRRIEERYDLAFLQQTRRARYQAPVHQVVLARRPALAITLVETQVGRAPRKDVTSECDIEPGRLPVVRRTTWAALLTSLGEVSVTYACGHAAGQVPDHWQQAVLCLVADLYDHRHDRVAPLQGTAAWSQVESLLAAEIKPSTL